MAKKVKKPTENIVLKPPVVVVLGHVDHGKSSLLEAIKDFKITEKEAGGITQHIGAYEVEHNDRKITFIDTPGHEAFSAMRLRGAGMASIALLVIDTAQSVQSQTKEAITTIKKSDVPLVVVLNKIDLPTADPERVKRELTKADVLVESMGGKVPSVEVSAKDKKGIDDLLEMILLVADLHPLPSDTKSPAEGIIVESYIDSLKGPVATVIVEKGILRKKDVIAAGSATAKIKSLENFRQKPIEEAYPGQPVVVLGFQTPPGIGEKFRQYISLKEAEAHAKGQEQKKTSAAVLDTDPAKKFLNIVLKGDFLGSLEAIDSMIKNLPQDKVVLRVVKNEVGDINESDVKLAQTTRAHIFGFRVKINQAAIQLLKKNTKREARIKTFDIIYELVQDIRNALEKSLEKEIIRQDAGKIKVLVIFFGEKNRQIVGGKITEGEIKRGLKLDVIRNEEKAGSGKIINLQRDKKEVDLLKKGDECGILFEGNIKVEEGDILVAFTQERQKKVL